jgi:dinuclear metal center YbgI/SA1388 family protein
MAISLPPVRAKTELSYFYCMQIGEIISFLESLAPPFLQEQYDNSGLLTGNKSRECSGVLVTLDATEDVIAEAKTKGCNLVVTHHPIIFSGLKKITGSNYVERAVIASIKHDIAIYAIHTNLDNILTGVNATMAKKLGINNCSVLKPKPALLKKLYTFVPLAHIETVRAAIFKAGAGHIGNYSECSFQAGGTGTFKAGAGTNPFVGEVNKLHFEEEMKLEVIFPAWLEYNLIRSLKDTHPYEEVAFDIISLDNQTDQYGSGIVGELASPMNETDFLQFLKQQFGLTALRHTPLLKKPIHKVAVCGGAGSFLTKTAIAAGADVFVTADVKYHEFFDADGKLVVADIGHWESEQFTIDLLADNLKQKFPTFAVLKTGVKTNPVDYF